MFGLILIGLVLALLSLETAPPEALPDAATVLAWMAALAAGVFLAGLLVGSRVLGRVPGVVGDEQRFFRRVGHAAKAYRVLVLAAYAAMLFVLDWSALANRWAGEAWASLAFLLAVAPLLVLLALAWTALFRADRRLRALVFARAGVVAVGWTLPAYLVFLARQYLLVALVPVTVLLACRDLLGRLLGPEGDALTGLVLLVGLVVAAALAGPWIRLCWPTEPLADAPLRRRLLDLAHRADIRLGNILLWRTHLSIANGCMVGSVGPLRYILITDALLAALPDDELEAVFAHEMAHVKYRHVSLYLALAVGAMGATVLAAEAVGTVTASPAAALAAIAAVALGYWWLVFGFVSRRCEAESDLFAVRAAACPVGCTSPDASRDPGAAPACVHRVAVFTSALRRIARLNGAAETARGWRHWSVARRCRFLDAIVLEPDRARRFERFMARLKVGVLLLSLALAAAAACLLAAQSFSEADHPEDPAGPCDVFPSADRWIVRLIDRHEMDALAFRAPQFHRHADAALEFHDGGLARLGLGAPPAEDDVVVQDPRRHAVAVHPQAERPRFDLPGARQVHELQAPVGRRFG